MKLEPGERRVWVGAAAIAVGVIAGVTLLFRAPRVTPAAKSPATPAVEPIPGKPRAAVGITRLDVEGGSTMLREEATLRDPTPLFLPTRWNASEEVVPVVARVDPGRAFRSYGPWLEFSESELKLNLPPPVAVPRWPADAFAFDRPAQPFAGFGQTDRPVTALPERGAFVRVISENDGREVFAEALAKARPPGDLPWEPLAFVVAVDATGVVRPPVLTESSRVASVDDYFQRYLTRTLHVGERLAPGFYRVSIGP